MSLTNKKETVEISIKLSETLEPFLSYKEIDEIYICGGFIRDLFIGGTPGKDIDIFINCNKDELFNLTKYLSSYGSVAYGQYGSPRYFPFSAPKGSYIDIVPFYNFIVSDNLPTRIEDLLHDFDFSANALAYDIKTGRLYNPENGLRDIQDRCLRAIRTDFPEKQVSSDIPLSTNTVFWFRLLHFQSKLEFIFESSTEKWIIENAWRQRDLEKFTRYFFKPDISPEMKLKLFKDNVHGL